MATAVQPSTQPRSKAPAGLLVASLAGAAFLLAGVLVAGYLVPVLWREAVAPLTARLGGFFDVFLRVAAQVAVVLGLVALGSRLAGTNPPHGVRGGIFLIISAVITIFFVTRAVWMNFGESSRPIAAGVTLAVLVLAAVRFLAGRRARGWMHAIEQGGWFHVHSYKRTQGLRVRRWTMIGLLLALGSGVYTLVSAGYLPAGDWKTFVPFVNERVTLLTDVRYTLPLLLVAATVWVAWRAVNVPTFADFLIATEAEMNKVSWTSRRRLMQDTVVVLVTTLILTLFLLAVDLFWGWLLSAVNVLPQVKDRPPADPQGLKSEW